MLHLALLAAAGAADVALELTLTEIVAPDAGAAVYYPDLIVTPDGVVHVLFAENFSDELRYTFDDGAGWSAPTVVSTVSDSGPFNLELRLDADGRVAAVFDPGPGDTLGVARRDDAGAWTVTGLTSGARWLDLLFTDDGVMHGAYSAGGLWYGSDAGGAWGSEPVRSSGSFEERYPILVDEGGEAPAVVFVDRADFSNPAVRIARRDAGVWGFEAISEAGEGPVGVAQDGALHAVFRRVGEGGAYAWVWATDDGSGWTEVGSGLTAENTGVGDGSGLDVHAIGDGLLWADGVGGLRFVLADAGGWRTFVQSLPAPARTVRLEVDGERLLALVGTEDNGVYVATLSLADADADGVAAAFDGCPELADPAQLDVDADAVGDACDCGDDGQCTGWTDAGGYCDASTPDRTDPDCDLCAVGPDADEDGVTDACDACPDDPDKVEPGDCGCGVADPCAEEPVDEGCGCATRGAPGGLAALGLLALAWRRRR